MGVTHVIYSLLKDILLTPHREIWLLGCGEDMEKPQVTSSVTKCAPTPLAVLSVRSVFLEENAAIKGKE